MNSGTSFLGRLPLFADVSSETLTRLEHRMRRRECAPRAVIVREGTNDDSAFLILSGRVAVRRKDADSGIEFLLAELGEGEMFGEMALLTRKPRAASVFALEATTCGIIEQSDFDQLLAEHPGAVRAMMAVLAERLHTANRHVGVDFVNLSRVKIDPRVLRLLPQAIVTEHKVIPIAFANNRLTLAMTNPSNVVAFDDVRRVIKGVLIEPAVVTDDDFKRFMTASYPQLIAAGDGSPPPQRPPGVRPAVSSTPANPGSAGSLDLLESDLIRELQLAADTEDQQAETKQDLMSASEDAPIIKLANSILGLAIKQGASDIHIEPMETDVTARFRIDGNRLDVCERVACVSAAGSRCAAGGRNARQGNRAHSGRGRTDRPPRVHDAAHNSAAAAFTRLHEMDVEPFLVSSSTIGVIAQRLARRLCQQCKEPHTVDANIARFWSLQEGATIFRANGCSACGGKGVRGRVGVYEVMKVTPRIRAMIGSAARSEEIHAAAVEEGMIDLKHYSAWLLTEGLTNVEEVTSVVSVDI